MILNLCQKRKQDVYVGREVDKRSDVRRKNFVIIYFDKYRSMSFPKTHCYLCFPRKSGVKLFQSTRVWRLSQIYDFCLRWHRIILRGLKFVGFLKGLESFGQFSYKTITNVMEQNERRNVSSFACGVN